MINLKLVGQNVKKYRKKMNMTQDQLAEAVDISTVHMSHIETGAVCMSVDCLLKVCNILEITPNHLLLYDFALKKDPSLIDERLAGLSGDEFRLVLRFAELLREEKINQHPSARDGNRP